MKTEKCFHRSRPIFESSVGLRIRVITRNYSDFYVITAYARFLRENSAQKLFGVNRMVTCSTSLFSATEYVFCMEIETSPIDLTNGLAETPTEKSFKHL